MRILHFSTDDISGGAAKAAHRLHSALREFGHESQMVVMVKKSDDDQVIQAPPPAPRPIASRFERLSKRIPILRDRQPSANYTFNFDLPTQINLEKWIAETKQSPEIICLHWINGFLDVKAIRRLYDHFRCPVVWIMADQEPMTGGCHYSFDCKGFRRECGNCPQLTRSYPNDHSHVVWKRKRGFLSEIPICFIAPTSWGRERLRQSSLFQNHRCELIPYPIDDQIFRPFDRRIARDLLHLPQEKKVIFFGATYLEDPRKGMALLVEALNLLAQKFPPAIRDNVHLLVAGLNGKPLMEQLPFSGKYVGQLHDDVTLALAYQAADVFVCPSVEEAGPMMIPEAMMCGTPVAAFHSGGAPDLIESKKNGYLAKYADAYDLAHGILVLLETDNEQALRDAAVSAAKKKHLPKVVARMYSELYRSLVRNG